MRIDWNNNLAPIHSVSAVTPQPRLDFEPQESAPAANAANNTTEPPALPPGNLTPENLRAALLEIGIAADPETMQLAEAFARLGLPITDANIVEGRSILARYPKLPAAAYAMAKLLDAPLSAGVLRALARVLEGALENRPLPEEILSDLSLALQGSENPQKVAKELYQIVARLGRSTEQRLSQVEEFPDNLSRSIFRADPRAQLLNLMNNDPTLDRATRAAADAHAAHIEGQQLLNQIALNRFDPPVPLYFAFPYRISDAQTVTAEVQVWTRDEEHKSGAEEFDDGRLVLQTTIRLSPPKLGLLEIRLSGRQDATLACHVLVERPASYRLLRRSSMELAQGLAAAGWNIDDIAVGMAQEFEPLWYGGASLAHPRGRVDQKA